MFRHIDWVLLREVWNDIPPLDKIKGNHVIMEWFGLEEALGIISSFCQGFTSLTGNFSLNSNLNSDSFSCKPFPHPYPLIPSMHMDCPSEVCITWEKSGDFLFSCFPSNFIILWWSWKLFQSNFWAGFWGGVKIGITLIWGFSVTVHLHVQC